MKKNPSLFINDIKEFRKRGGQPFNGGWYQKRNNKNTCNVKQVSMKSVL